MLTTCLSCHRPFPANETLEYFPVGRRIAFDPARGRLWAICPSCARWTLAPFETRWEALEELERVTRDQARLLVETDNIELLAAGDIEIVRVGHAGLREESWWRFGKEFAARRKRAKRQVLKGKIINAAWTTALAGFPFWGFTDADRWIDRARRRQFGKKLWDEPLPRCPRCGHSPKRLRFTDTGLMEIRPHGADPFALAVGCPECGRGPGQESGGGIITGIDAEHMLRRILAYHNFAGGTEGTVQDAVGLVESYENTDRLLRRVAEHQVPLGQMTEKGAFALEIALSADVERRLLEMELKELEARWQREEEIAAIADTL